MKLLPCSKVYWRPHSLQQQEWWIHWNEVHLSFLCLGCEWKATEGNAIFSKVRGFILNEANVAGKCTLTADDGFLLSDSCKVKNSRACGSTLIPVVRVKFSSATRWPNYQLKPPQLHLSLTLTSPLNYAFQTSDFQLFGDTLRTFQSGQKIHLIYRTDEKTCNFSSWTFSE